MARHAGPPPPANWAPPPALAYMRRVKIRPVGKELAKLKRDQCKKPGVVDNEVTLKPKTKRKKLDMDRVLALADSDSDEEPMPVAKRTRGRPKGSKSVWHLR